MLLLLLQMLLLLLLLLLLMMLLFKKINSYFELSTIEFQLVFNYIYLAYSTSHLLRCLCLKMWIIIFYFTAFIYCGKIPPLKWPAQAGSMTSFVCLQPIVIYKQILVYHIFLETSGEIQLDNVGDCLVMLLSVWWFC